MSKAARILITEDDIDSAFILKSILLQAGHKVLAVVKSGAEAIREAREQQLDIILMDINIHGDIDGVDAAAIIYKELKIPIIYLTGHSDKATVDRAKASEPFGFILKPYTPKEVQITLEMALYKSSVDKKIKANEEKLSMTLSSLHDAVISLDKAGCIAYLNPIAEKHFNCVLADVEGVFIEKLLNLTNFETGVPIEKIFGFLEQKQTPEDRFRYFSTKNKDDREFIVQVHVSQHLDGEGEVESYTIVLHNVTKQYFSERQNRMMATVLESMQDAVVIVEPNNKTFQIVYVNSGFELLTGQSKEVFVGQEASVLCEGKKNEQLLFAIDHTFKTKRSFKLELACKKGEKKIITQWDGFPVTDKRGRLLYLALIVRDMSHSRKMEENLRRSQKIEAIGRLASGVAHDFNNILSVINSYSDILKLNIDPGNQFYKYVENIREAGTKGANLVAQLMTFSRREPMGPHKVNVGKVISGMEHILKPLLSKIVQLKIHLKENTFPVRADETQIEQILINLAVNARDAMPEGGILTLSVENFEIHSDADKAVDSMQSGQYVRLRVEDNGDGMDEETLKHMFDPFFTTKDIGEGTGLGLSTVYGIVKQYGGAIDVRSNIGEGSRFDLYFPVYWETAETEEILPSEKPIETERKQCVCLIQNDSKMRECLSGLLNVNGYNPLQVADESGLKKVLEQDQPFDLFVVDLDNVSAETQALLNRQCPATPQLLLTSDNELSFSEETKLLVKPFGLKAFVEKVDVMIKSGFPALSEVF